MRVSVSRRPMSIAFSSASNVGRTSLELSLVQELAWPALGTSWKATVGPLRYEVNRDVAPPSPSDCPREPPPHRMHEVDWDHHLTRTMWDDRCRCFLAAHDNSRRRGGTSQLDSCGERPISDPRRGDANSARP